MGYYPHQVYQLLKVVEFKLKYAISHHWFHVEDAASCVFVFGMCFLFFAVLNLLPVVD